MSLARCSPPTLPDWHQAFPCSTSLTGPAVAGSRVRAGSPSAHVRCDEPSAQRAQRAAPHATRAAAELQPPPRPLVLPRAAGVLCRAHYLLFEWHLNSLPQGARLSGLALRHSIARLLSHCPTPPRSVAHEEYPDENLGLPVDGLADLMLEHNGTAPRGVSKSFAKWMHDGRGPRRRARTSGT